jgi:hypothetical protein
VPAKPPTTPSAAPSPTRSPKPKSISSSTSPALKQLAALAVRDETRAGYDRDLFRMWVDTDHDGCDTRREVLIIESLTPVTVGPRCTISGGKWRSAYDAVTTTDPSTFDVDHFVPLAEAWDSGAYAWSPTRREAFANDLKFGGSLIAVTASSNRSKSDADPAEWEPPLESYECTYAANWVVVKTRWALSVNAAEVSALRTTLLGCPASAASASSPAVVPIAPATTPPKATPRVTGNCSPSYPDFCIPPPPPDLNCADVSERNFRVRFDVPDPDPHRFDGNRDGVGCEN